MRRCEKCFEYYDETIAFEVCPHCGHVNKWDEKNKTTITMAMQTQSLYPDTGSKTDPKKSSGRLEDKEPRHLPKGTILRGRYEVDRVIGIGGFGITYKVWDSRSSQYKAIKEYFQKGVVNRIPGTKEVIISSEKRREEFLYGKTRLLNEARIIAKFQSPSIVYVDDYFEENNTSYMVMEYLESQTLEDYIVNRKQVLDPEQAIDIGIRICDALEEIHRAGVLHRDIAPDNIFIDKNGNIKIIDFGSARLSKEDTDGQMIVIKPGFAPPEQYEKIDLKNDRQREWTDVYALGATLYLCLTGKVPAESSERKIAVDSGADPVAYPKELNPQIPEFLSNTIMTALAVEVHERFKNPSEFKSALKQERKVLPVEEARKRKKLIKTVGIRGGFLAAAIVMIIGFGIDYIKSRAILHPADVTIWYTLSTNPEQAQQKQTAMESIIQALKESDKFSKITFEPTGFSEEEYSDKLKEAYEQGKMPVLFESNDLNSEYPLSDVNIKEIMKTSKEINCSFLDKYASGFDGTGQLPIGFDIPVIYINNALVPDYKEEMEIDSMEDLMALCEGEMIYKPMAVKKDWITAYEKMLPDFKEYEAAMEEYTMQDFLDGKAVVYFSDISDYYTIRNEKAGYFSVEPVNAERIVCSFTNVWNISECNDAQETAAKHILSCFLNNYSQDQYYLQTQNPGLPLDQAVLQEYPDVQWRFSDFLSESNTDKFVFER